MTKQEMKDVYDLLLEKEQAIRTLRELAEILQSKLDEAREELREVRA